MVWSLDRPYDVPSTNVNVAPSEVLYEFDGPQIFRSRFGFFDTAFLKLDELSGGLDLWLCTITDDNVISLIRKRRLSVRGAFLRDQCWIIATDQNWNVRRFWVCTYSDLTEDMLPSPGVAISGSTRVPDTVEQATSYFSIGFRGGTVGTGQMPFSSLKLLIDAAYDVAKKILYPESMDGSRSATIDLLVLPKISSLILSIEEPILNAGRIEQKFQEEGTSVRDIEGEMRARRSGFIANLKSVVDVAGRGEVNGAIEDDSRSTIEKVKYIIPDYDSRYGSIEFTALEGQRPITVFIDREVGGRIHRAYDRSGFTRSERIGVIVEINAESYTFLLKGRDGRLTTCVAGPQTFELLEDLANFKIGLRLGVKGNLERRKRRDRIFLSSFPTILD